MFLKHLSFKKRAFKNEGFALKMQIKKLYFS